MTIASNSAEKVLILGCGDIGRRLAQRLAPLGYGCLGVRRTPTANIAYLDYVAADLTQTNSLAQILQKSFEVIVVSMTPSERSDSGYERAYVQTVKNLMDELNNLSKQSHSIKPPRLLVLISSTAVYAQDDGSWVDEESHTQPINFSGKRLLEAEQIICHSGYSHCIVRFSGIYGPGRRRLIEQVVNKRASASTHFTNRIHAEDCAGVIAHLIELQKTQRSLEPLYLATDSSPTPMVDVVSWIAEQLSITDFLSPEATNERGNKRVSNRRLLQSGYKFSFPDFRAGYKELLLDK